MTGKSGYSRKGIIIFHITRKAVAHDVIDIINIQNGHGQADDIGCFRINQLSDIVEDIFSLYLGPGLWQTGQI